VLKRLLLILGSATVAALLFGAGVLRGQEVANYDMWYTPPGFAYCVVYPDGGKRCKPKTRPAEPKNFVECARMCRAQERMK
jgi:hypothetical protein